MIMLKGRSQRIEVLAFAPSGDEFLSAGNGSWLDRWQFVSATKPERMLEASGAYSEITDAVYIDGGKAVLAACGSDGLRVQPLASDSAFHPATYPGLWALMSLAVSPDGAQVVGFNHGYPFLQRTGRRGFNCWVPGDAGQLRPSWSCEVPSGWCRGMAFLPGGIHFAACELTGHTAAEHNTRLVVREATRGEIVAAFPCPYLFVEQLVLSPDGRFLLGRSGMGLVVWQVDDLSRPPRKVLNDNRKHFTGVAYHPSGRFLAATSNDKTVKLWDTSSWQVAQTFTWNVGRLRSATFSPDGLLAAAGGDKGRVVVWDVDA